MNLGDIYTIGLERVRLWDCTFYDHRDRAELYLGYDFSYPKSTNLLTLNTNFTLVKDTLETGALNFLQEAESRNIIKTSFFAKVYHEETSYAASK